MGATRTITTGLGIVAALVLSACGNQVAGSGQPPVLRIGSSNGVSLGAAMDAARPAAANAAKGGAASSADPYPLHGTLPTGPSSAPVYRYADTQIAESRVAALATALGLTGTPTRHAHGWAVAATPTTPPVRDGSAPMLLVRDGSGQWSFARGGDQCPVYSVDIDNPAGASSGVGCAVTATVAAPPLDTVATPPIADCAPAATPCADVIATPCPTDKGCLCPDGGSACKESINTGGTIAGTTVGSGGPVTSPTAAPKPCVSGDPQPGVVGCPVPSPPPVGAVRANPPISDARALEAAKPVLAALGLGDAAPRVMSSGSWSDVTVDPTVAGLPTQGITTRISVDATGVVGAIGWLGEPSEGPIYPLVSAAQALDRLRTLPVPEIAIACIQGSECPSGVLVRPVTGATLGLALRWDGSGAVGTEVLVPAWLFSLEGSTEPLAWVAVQDAYLGDPTPDPGVIAPGSGSSPGNPGSGATTPDNPGTSAAPPSPLPATASPAPGEPSGQHTLAITSVTLGKDGRTLAITGFGGMCEDFSARAEESSSSVTLSLVGTPNQDAGKACPAMAKEVSVTVALAAPWDKRQLVDAATGQTLNLS